MRSEDLADWRDFFVAAINGFCAATKDHDEWDIGAIVTLSEEVADGALSAYKIRREEAERDDRSNYSNGI